MKATKDEILKTLRDEISNAYERERWGIIAHDCLAKILQGWRGKKLTKRVATQFKDAFLENAPGNDAVVYWSREHGFVQVMVWGIGPWKDHSCRLQIHIAYDSQPTEPRLCGAWVESYNPDTFEYADNCHGDAAKARNKDRLHLIHFNDGAELDAIADAILANIQAADRLRKLTAFEKPGNQVVYTARELVEKFVQ